MQHDLESKLDFNEFNSPKEMLDIINEETDESTKSNQSRSSLNSNLD